MSLIWTIIAEIRKGGTLADVFEELPEELDGAHADFVVWVEQTGDGH